MKKLLASLFLFLFIIINSQAYAFDKKIISTNTFKIGIFDTSSQRNGISGLILSDIMIKVQCASTAVTINESGDTLTDEGGGFYRITTNDSLTPNNEDECLVWSEGTGNYAGLIAKSPVKFKAVGATIDATIPVGVISGTAGGSSTTTTIIDTTNLTSTSTGAYIGSVVIVDGETTIIKSFNPSTDAITLASTLSASAANKTYYLIPTSLWEILSRTRISR